MRMRLVAGAAALAAVLALAGCTGTAAPGSDAGDAQSSAPPAMDYGDTNTDTNTDTGGASAGDALATADSSLGTIVVDGAGMTVYVFDNDTQGTTASACTGQCLVNWPPVTTDSAAPQVDGVTGAVGTIDTPDGKKQVTLDGWPLYYFAGDSAAGDTNGQAVNGIWWVVSPAGAKISG